MMFSTLEVKTAQALLPTPQMGIRAHNSTQQALQPTAEACVEEHAEVAARTVSYTGPFSIEQEADRSHVLLHHVKLSSIRGWVGGVQKRSAIMDIQDGNTFLYLQPDAVEDENGVLRIQKLKWKKVDDGSKSKVSVNL